VSAAEEVSPNGVGSTLANVVLLTTPPATDVVVLSFILHVISVFGLVLLLDGSGRSYVSHSFVYNATPHSSVN